MLFKRIKEITLNFLKKYIPNIFEGVEMIKKFVADISS